MKIKKKRIRVLLGVLIASMLRCVPVAADGASGDEGNVILEEQDPDRMEEFMWFYRIRDGILQKRLWSLTYEYWVTDWIDVGPA